MVFIETEAREFRNVTFDKRVGELMRKGIENRNKDRLEDK